MSLFRQCLLTVEEVEYRPDGSIVPERPNKEYSIDLLVISLVT